MIKPPKCKLKKGDCLVVDHKDELHKVLFDGKLESCLWFAKKYLPACERWLGEA